MDTLTTLMDLHGKVAVVTGGAKGIGFGICWRLAEAGAAVLIADIDEAAAEQAAKELDSQGWTAVARRVDVASEAEIEAMVAACRDELGSLDILVNNAGIFPAIPLNDMSRVDFERVIDVNLRSVFLTTKYAAEVMKAEDGGCIINITSIDALHPSMVGLAHYDASKHGVWGFTKNSALELTPHRIRVNAIAPGAILTPGVEAMQAAAPGTGTVDASAGLELFLAKIPMRRMGRPDEIGTVALFLASGLSSYMTGEQVVVDGGALLS